MITSLTLKYDEAGDIAGSLIVHSLPCQKMKLCNRWLAFVYEGRINVETRDFPNDPKSKGWSRSYRIGYYLGKLVKMAVVLTVIVLVIVYILG